MTLSYHCTHPPAINRDVKSPPKFSKHYFCHVPDQATPITLSDKFWLLARTVFMPECLEICSRALPILMAQVYHF